MNHDAAPTDGCQIATVIRFAQTVVIDQLIRIFIPDFDTELIDVICVMLLGINGGEYKAIVSFSVNAACSLKLCSGSGNDQPVIAGGVEV